MKSRIEFFDNIFLILSFSILFFLLCLNLPLSVSVFVLVIYFWRYLIDRYNFFHPSRFLTNFFGVLSVLFIYWIYKILLYSETISVIMVILSALKVLELRDKKDLSFLTLLGTLLVATNFVFYYEIYIVLPSFIAFTFLMASLLRTDEKAWGRNSKYLFVLRMVGVSIPLAIVLFLFFPRNSNFALNLKFQNAKSGLGEGLSPGNVNELALSNDLVMRVNVDEQILSPKDLYWWADVLSESDGLSWHRGDVQEDNLEVHGDSNKNLNYSIIYEPGPKTLIAVHRKTSYLTSDNEKVFRRKNGIYYKQNLLSTDRFTVSGAFDLGQKSFLKQSQSNRKAYLQTPGVSEKVIALALKIKGANRKSGDIAKSLIDFYQSEKFYYTLKPGLNSNSLDNFLFKGKKGFCEHFAASGATLLRLMGVPSRTVFGYQGGEWNEFGHYYKITQKDAHAWIEYLDEDRLWHQLDIVDYIAPLRIELGGEQFFLLPEELLNGKSLKKLNSDLVDQLRSFARFIQMYFESINYNWAQFLLNFDFSAQKELIRKMQIPVIILLLISILIAVFVSFIFYSLSNRKKRNKNQFVDLYLQLQKWSEDNGLKKSSVEGPIHFSKRLKEKFPFKKQEIEQFMNIYLEARFSYHEKRAELKNAKQYLNRIKTQA